MPAIALSPHGDQWRAAYTLAQPATALRFARVDRHGNRTRDWKPLDGSIELALEDGEEVVRRRDGQPFEQVEFSIPPRYATLEKDYAPFFPFGDGGLLIHSGRFHACPERCPEDGLSPSWSIRISPPDGGHVIEGGRVIDGEHLFVDRDSGTNLYVGQALPVVTDHVVAVVDREFPTDAGKQLETLFPRLMDLYAAELGALPQKPMLFASNDAAHPGGGYGYQGGTLPGQVFVHLYGRHEAFGQAAFAERMNWFFAHEAGHLYQRYEQAADPAQSWIHEGGADAFAAVALRRLGLLPDEVLARRVRAAFDGCVGGLEALDGRALNASNEAGAFDNYYQCGMLMQLAIDTAARRRSDDGCDLLCVWRAFLDDVEDGARWNQDSFLRVVERKSGSDVAAFLHALAEQPQADPRGFLRDGLTAAGLSLPAVAAD